ncbi:MAG: type IV secretory system conjugative DNA transfer family protein [Anaerolineae bacterium]
MKLSLKRDGVTTGPAELVEVVTPRTNTASLTAAENFLAAISLPEPFSLEVAATGQARRFVMRVGSEAMRRHVAGQLGAAYPQAEIRPLNLTEHPDADPAVLRDGERGAACALVLRAPPYLPLRTFRDADVGEGPTQSDPILGVLGGLADLPPGWRGLSQVMLRPAPDNWSEAYLRLAVEHPLAAERAASQADTSLTNVFLTAALLVAVAVSYQAYGWYTERNWLFLGLLALAAIGGGASTLWLVHRLRRKKLYDMRLVQEKINRIAYRAEVRLAIFAPAEVPAAEVEARLGRLVAAYRQFNLAAGNGLLQRPLAGKENRLAELAPLLSAKATPVLNIRELAGLWHLPHTDADVPLLERTTARRWLPLPVTVERGCRIGVASHQGHAIRVALPPDLLRRHLLLVAKTRRGKSSLLLQLARYLMATPVVGNTPSALVLVDPHRDLARATLALVPESRRADVVYLDVANTERPFGLNLLDVGLGWNRDKAVANALTIFRHEFDRFWGPRMEDAFRFALLTLYSANQAIREVDPLGRARQHTLLDVAPVLVNVAFRQRVLKLVTDPVIRAWWASYFEPLDRRLQLEIVNPVQTKVQRFAGSQATRAIVGQPRSTVNPAGWLRSRSIVIVNTAKGVVGEDAAALIGGTLLNLVGLAVNEQAALEEKQRQPVTIIVDEFHTMPGADYESVLSELGKYGANLVLATQSLGRLRTLDEEHARSLQATVFANLDGLFAFHTSAEDAEYLVRELGGDVDAQDMVELGEYQCYAKLSVGGERTPPFSVRLDPPPQGNAQTCQDLEKASAVTYGRPIAAVEADLAAALARIAKLHPADEKKKDGGRASGDADDTAQASDKSERNQHRKKTPKGLNTRQDSLMDDATRRSLEERDGKDTGGEGGKPQ